MEKKLDVMSQHSDDSEFVDRWRELNAAVRSVTWACLGDRPRLIRIRAQPGGCDEYVTSQVAGARKPGGDTRNA